MQTGIPCTMMRGGTSKGAYFLAEDLPDDPAARDRVLLAVMGSPDNRQIDGLGGANPLTSKIAIVSPSAMPDTDIDYLFAQVVVDQPVVGYGQNCGNILAGVGQFAIEKDLVKAAGPVTDVTIHMVNSGDKAIASISTPDGAVNYEGNAQIDGVPGTAAPVPLNFLDTAGSMCGALLPTGNIMDEIDGVDVTCIDNGMPVVLLRAADMGISGTESVAELEANEPLKKRLENIRLKAGPTMTLDDVSTNTVPKMTMVSAPQNGGFISTRSFTPHRCHSTIGVFAAVTVATACLIPGTVAANIIGKHNRKINSLLVEHPTGSMAVDIDLELDNGEVNIKRSGFMRTARKLYEGTVFVPETES